MKLQLRYGLVCACGAWMLIVSVQCAERRSEYRIHNQSLAARRPSAAAG